MHYKFTVFSLFSFLFCVSQSTKSDSSHKYFETPSVLKQWKLDSANTTTDTETFKIEKHNTIYAVLAINLKGTNEMPSSKNPLNTVTESVDYDDAELKFQLSFKTLVFNNLFGSKLDFWTAYTQSSRWQVFNESLSRPFRETNYEPEAIFIHPLNLNVVNLNLSYIGLSLNHQSNGRSLPFSRSWNRVILEAGFQGENFTLQLRPWFRLSEDAAEDDNPEISNFVGRGEALCTYVYKRLKFQLNLRHSLRFGHNNRGSFNFNMHYKLQNALSLNAQVFHGYGENLLDYNYKQTMLSLGVSFL